jgi:hypothetical protein
MSDGRISRRLRALAVLAGTAFAAATMPGCSEDPTEANALVASLPLADVIVKDTTIVATGGTTFKQFIPLDGNLNLVGKSGNYYAYSALTFYPSLFPVRDTAQVYSAKMTLHCVTWFGDSTGRLAFNVYRITRGWTQSNVTWDTVQAGFFDQTVARTADGQPFSSGAGPDTQTVTISLDTAMVRQWLSTSTSTTDTKFGIVLVPTAGSNIIRGFTAFDYDSVSFQPHLTIIAGSPTGPSRDTAVYYQGIDTFVGNIDNLNTNPQLMYVQAGVDYRSSINFNVSFIPRGAIINNAELLLQKDPATTHITKFTTDTALTAQTITSASDPTLLDGVAATGRRKDGTGLTFSTNLRRTVQLWVHGQNYGVVIRPSGLVEYNSLDLLTFYNYQAANAALRPKLKIIYSIAR